MDPFKIIQPREQRQPILLSIPHCGTEFPPELKNQYVQEMTLAPDDTDWYVHRLYDFAPAMGITVIHAIYSRWVIDLNRHPESKPLYTDGRIITALCPATDFFGRAIYTDQRTEVQQEEVQRRIDRYYKPYHDGLKMLLEGLKSEFGRVLLWDCHSIRRHVPTIRKDPFPDLILGDADGTSASPGLSELALQSLEQGTWTVSHNHPFKGGYITRRYGMPLQGVHALQLEMSKVNYMNDAETGYDDRRAEGIRALLRKTLARLGEQLLEPGHD